MKTKQREKGRMGFFGLIVAVVFIISLFFYIFAAETENRRACESLSAKFGDKFRVRDGFHKESTGLAIDSSRSTVTLLMLLPSENGESKVRATFKCLNLEKIQKDESKWCLVDNFRRKQGIYQNMFECLSKSRPGYSFCVDCKADHNMPGQ